MNRSLFVLLLSFVFQSAPAAALECRVTLIDGNDTSGELVKLTAAGVELKGREQPVAYHEMRLLEFPGRALAAADEKEPPTAGPFIRFVGGETLPGRILGSDGKLFRLLVRGPKASKAAKRPSLGELAVALTALRAFRLREAHGSDAVFESTLAEPPPKNDLVFVRRADRLIKIECVFRKLDDVVVTVEYNGEEKRIKRTRVQGLIFSPVAGKTVERGEEGTLHLLGGGRVPATVTGLADLSTDTPRLTVDVRGAAWSIDLRYVEGVRFAGDRIRFLSDLTPVDVSEIGFFGNPFPYKNDLAVSGGRLRLRGVEYRKGLGVHSRSTLDYQLDDSYASFVARVGIDDAVGARGGATIRVLGNGRKLFEGKVAGGGAPLDVAVSIIGLKRLTIETDFGDDGDGLGDHVDWAEARLVKAAKETTPTAATENESK